MIRMVGERTDLIEHRNGERERGVEGYRNAEKRKVQ